MYNAYFMKMNYLKAFEKFVAVKDYGDGSAFKVDGKRGESYVGKAGETKGSKVKNNDN